MRIIGQIGLVLFLFGTLTRLTAQVVYSVNLVGYTSKTIPLVAPVTLAYISNPLNLIDNRLSTILPGVPDGTAILVHRNGAMEEYIYFDGVWLPEDTTLPPGEGAIIALDQSASNPTVLTFVGEVSQGLLVNPIPPGESLRASKAPITGLITSQLGLNPRDSDALQLFNENTQSLVTYVYSFDFGWEPIEPTVRVGQSFRYFNASGTVNNWIQSFNPLPFTALDAAPVAPAKTYPLPSASMLCLVGGPDPRLRVSRIPSQVVISWPIEFSSYQLENTANPATGGWSRVAQEPVTVQNRRQVTLEASTPRNFFRLKFDPVPGQEPTLFFKTCVPSAMGLYWQRSFTGHRVEQTDSLLLPSWTLVPQSPMDTNGFLQLSVPIDVTERFFRLRSVQQGAN